MTPPMIVILIDALGWEIVKEYKFCRGIFPVSRCLDTILGYSSAAIPSLLTGKTPSEHGIWSMYKFDPKRSYFKHFRYLRRIPNPLARRLKHLAKNYMDRKGIIRGYFDFYEIPNEFISYFDLSQKGDPYSPGGCTAESIFDRLKLEGVRFKTWDYRSPEEDNFRELLSAIGQSSSFLFLYTAELDAIMHSSGIHSELVEKKLKEYERFIERILFKASKVSDEASVYVFSDHGMKEVSSALNLWGKIEQSGLKMEENYMAFYDSTMARFWNRSESMEKIMDVLNSIELGKVMTNEELTDLGCFFEDGSYGEKIFLVDPGVMIVPSFMGREKLQAMHGYHPDDPFSKACFLTNDVNQTPPGSILDLKEFLLKGVGKRGQ